MMAEYYNLFAQPPLGYLNALVYFGLAQVEIILNWLNAAAAERRRPGFRFMRSSGACFHLDFPLSISCDLVYFIHDDAKCTRYTKLMQGFLIVLCHKIFQFLRKFDDIW